MSAESDLSGIWEATQRLNVEIAEFSALHGSAPALPLFPDTNREDLVARADRLYRARRRRDRDFEGIAHLFHDPAWDVLLDLFVAGETGRTVSITSACIAAAVPTTTAQRHIMALEHAGAVCLEGDPHDRRRRYVRLALPIREQMVTFLSGPEFTR